MPDHNTFKPTITAEKFIQKAILDYLRARGYVVWRSNSGVFRPENKNGTRRFFRAGVVGGGDVLGLTKEGKFFTIEVKRRGAKPTPDQIEFMDRVKASNGLAILAYDVDDVIKYL